MMIIIRSAKKKMTAEETCLLSAGLFKMDFAFYLKRCIPESLRQRLRARFLGYDYGKIDLWASSLGEMRAQALRSVHQCIRFENLPYFTKGVFSYLWKSTDKSEGIIAAADNYLYGEKLEWDLLKEWKTASPQDEQAERNMVRVLNESILHAVRFCGLWSNAYAGKGYGDEFGMKRLAALLDQCPGRPLDIATGGLPFYPLVKRRADWMVSDMNLPALRIMRYVLGLEAEHFACHDAQRMPFPDGSFHVVTSRYVIENLLRPEDMLREVSRILCPGASFLLAIPPVVFRKNADRYPTNRGAFPSRKEFLVLCERAGFQLAKFYDRDSVYHLKKPGKLDDARWERGFQCPDSSSRDYGIQGQAMQFADGHRYPCIDEIPVLLPEKLMGEGFGRLGLLGDIIPGPSGK